MGRAQPKYNCDKCGVEINPSGHKAEVRVVEQIPCIKRSYWNTREYPSTKRKTIGSSVMLCVNCGKKAADILQAFIGDA